MPLMRQDHILAPLNAPSQRPGNNSLMRQDVVLGFKCLGLSGVWSNLRLRVRQGRTLEEHRPCSPGGAREIAASMAVIRNRGKRRGRGSCVVIKIRTDVPSLGSVGFPTISGWLAVVPAPVPRVRLGILVQVLGVPVLARRLIGTGEYVPVREGEVFWLVASDILLCQSKLSFRSGRGKFFGFVVGYIPRRCFAFFVSIGVII